MFCIRQWVPSSPTEPGAWKDYTLSGNHANLRQGVKYKLDVRVEGSLISLEVNGVPVALATLPVVLSQYGQTGIFCQSQSDIIISDFTVESEHPKVFIVMQFSQQYDEVYTHVIKELCDKFKLDAIRGDEIYGPGIIIKDVTDRISRSQVIIADISPTNPNVYFEVGYALALGKPIIPTATLLEHTLLTQGFMEV